MQAHEITKFLTSQRKSGAPGFSWWFATITACLPLDSRIFFLGSTNWGSWMEPIPSSHEVHVTVDLRSQSMSLEPYDAIRIYLVSIAQATKWATMKPPVFAQQATSLQMAKVRQVAFACYHHPRGRPKIWTKNTQRITGVRVETFSWKLCKLYNQIK